MSKYIQGMLIGLAYVAPIGMQNLFVINSALTQPRRRAVAIALIVIFFDVALTLACFFGAGALMERFEVLRLALLLIGGCIVIGIGVGLLREKPRLSQTDMDLPLTKIAAKAFVVTWINPQGLIDGTMLIGGFRAGNPGMAGIWMLLGANTASVLWFLGVTVLISCFSARFNNRVLRIINVVCGCVIIVYGGKLVLQFFQTVL